MLIRDELIDKAKERLQNMKFEKEFYEAIYKKIPDEKYQIRIQQLESDITELDTQIKIFKGGE